LRYPKLVWASSLDPQSLDATAEAVNLIGNSEVGALLKRFVGQVVQWPRGFQVAALTKVMHWM
jgi:hypothetical protein